MRIALVFAALSFFLALTTLAYIASAFDPLNGNGGVFGIVLALMLFGLPSAASAWFARRFWRR